MEVESKNLLHIVGIKTILEINSRLGMLSGGQQQGKKISRTIYFKAKLVILSDF